MSAANTVNASAAMASGASAPRVNVADVMMGNATDNVVALVGDASAVRRDSGAGGSMEPPSVERAVSPGETSMTDASMADHDNACSDSMGPIHREFVCMNDEYSECVTGQYTLKLARKVISNYFGRNKACTRLIKEWPLFCRKHYQRATYKPDLWQRRKVNLILRQFGVIERLYPGTTYTVSLKKSEMDRVNLFARSLDLGHSAQEAGEIVAPDPEVKSFQAPIDVLRELQHHLGPNKSLHDVKLTLSLINGMLRAHETAEVPSIEFLPQIPDPVADAKVAATKTKPKPKAKSKSKAKVAKASTRVSKKGGVQKLRK